MQHPFDETAEFPELEPRREEGEGFTDWHIRRSEWRDRRRAWQREREREQQRLRSITDGTTPLPPGGDTIFTREYVANVSVPARQLTAADIRIAQYNAAVYGQSVTQTAEPENQDFRVEHNGEMLTPEEYFNRVSEGTL